LGARLDGNDEKNLFAVKTHGPDDKNITSTTQGTQTPYTGEEVSSALSTRGTFETVDAVDCAGLVETLSAALCSLLPVAEPPEGATGDTLATSYDVAVVKRYQSRRYNVNEHCDSRQLPQIKQ